jgi:hypothetical protein
MAEFSELRARIHDENRQVVERRVYAVTGQHLPEDDIDRMIETGQAETIFQRAILEQGRGRVLDTLAEIQERNRAVKDLEASLLELHQIFLDMAVLVEAQGEMLDNIEKQVAGGGGGGGGGGVCVCVCVRARVCLLACTQPTHHHHTTPSWHRRGPRARVPARAVAAPVRGLPARGGAAGAAGGGDHRAAAKPAQGVRGRARALLHERAGGRGARVQVCVCVCVAVAGHGRLGSEGLLWLAHIRSHLHAPPTAASTTSC